MASFTLSQLLEPLAGIAPVGNITFSNVIGPAILDEASSGTNPTLIPNRASLTTGIGGFDQGPGGHFLNLIVQGQNAASFDLTIATFNTQFMVQNGSLFVDGDTGTDVLQLLVRGNATQTNDLFQLEQSTGTDVLTVSNIGVLTMPLSTSVIAVGAIPAVAGTLRLSNVNDITMRGVGNAVDMNILSTPNSDEFDFLDATMPVVRIAPARIECNRITITNTGSALTIQSLLGVGVLQVISSIGLERVRIGTATTPIPLTIEAASGGQRADRSVTTTVLTPSGASATAVGLIPAGAFVLSVTARVITGITGPAGFDLGDGVIVDRWGNSILAAIGTTVDITDYTSSALQLYPAANDVVITSDGVDFTGGEVRLVVHYIDFTAPTS